MPGHKNCYKSLPELQPCPEATATLRKEEVCQDICPTPGQVPPWLLVAKDYGIKIT
jgi:hypothetical protein